VYYPDVGWLQFDPTPANDREESEQSALDTEIEQTGIEPTGTDGQSSFDSGTDTGVEQNGSAGNTTRSTIPDRLREQLFSGNPSNIMNPASGINGSEVDASGSGETTERDDSRETLLPVSPPPTQQFALGLVVLFGLAAGFRQSPTVDRIASRVRFRFRRDSDPATDIERIHDQLLMILEQHHRPRRRGETMRAYLDDIDAGWSARKLASIRERARYADDVTAEDVDEALGQLRTVRRSYRRVNLS
jgi:hypothetical protein